MAMDSQDGAFTSLVDRQRTWHLHEMHGKTAVVWICLICCYCCYCLGTCLRISRSVRSYQKQKISSLICALEVSRV